MKLNEILSQGCAESLKEPVRHAIPYLGHLLVDAIGAHEYTNIRPGSSVPWGTEYMGGNGYILTMLNGDRVFLDADLEKNTIYLSQISVEKRNSGLGTKVMTALHEIAKKHNWNIVIYKVSNHAFFDRFNWLRKKRCRNIRLGLTSRKSI